MSMLFRLVAIVLAVAILLGVVHLGILSGRDPKFVVWFGIASAIAAPVALSLLGYALSRGDRKVLERLSKVTEMERLIAEAETREERIKLLEEQHVRLAETVRLESRRQAILDRRDNLDREAVRLLGELDTMDEELRALNLQIVDSPISTEVQQLHERVKAREHGDVMIRVGSRFYRIDRDILLGLPFNLGYPLLSYLRVLERLRRRLEK